MQTFKNISGENLMDIAQYYPHFRLYLNPNSTEFVETELGDLRLALYEWEGDMVTHRAVDIIKQALEEGEDWIVHRVMDRLGFDNQKLNAFVFVNAVINNRQQVLSTLTQHGYRNWNVMVKAAAKVGDLDAIKKVEEEHHVDWYNTVLIAAECGHAHIINYLLDNEEDPGWLYLYLIGATAKGGYREIMEGMIDYEQLDDVGRTFIVEKAAEGGNFDIAKDMIESDRDYLAVAPGAALHGNRELVFELLEKAPEADINVRVLNKIAENAAKAGNKQIVDDMLAGVVKADGTVVRANDYSMIVLEAAEGGHKEIVDQMIELGVHEWDTIAKGAAKAGYKKIVTSMLERGVDLHSLKFGKHEDAKLYFNS